MAQPVSPARPAGPSDVPDFSIATPTRNALASLRRCIGSVRGQTGVTLEHLVQDGDSADGTPQWLTRLAAARPELLPASAPDAGMYDAINRAWLRSRGRYLSWLNADEQYLPGTLQRVKALFQAHPAADALFADYVVADPRGRVLALRREIPLRPAYVRNGFLYAQSCTLFFRRELLADGALMLDAGYRYAADKDLVLRLLARGVRFLHVPELWSVFGVDGRNLSTHSGMAIEAEAVRRAHGAMRMPAARALLLGARRVEKTLRGAYRRHELHLRFALDEEPRYLDVHARRVGGRYDVTRLPAVRERSR